MTRETRTLIELQDILGIEIECQNPKCGAKLMLPIKSQFPQQREGRCFQCNAEWFGTRYDIATGQGFAAAMEQINDLMSRIAHLSSKERSDIHVPIRLHVANLLGDAHASSGKG